MNELQKLLQTEKSTDHLLSWNMAFVTTDGRCEYSTPIYKVLLDALASSNFTGRLLVFARDIFGMSQYPTYLMQMVPVTKEDEAELRSPGYKNFTAFRDLVDELFVSDSGVNFLAEYAEIADPYEPLHQSILRGNIVFENGRAVRFTPADEVEQTLFEESLKARFSGIKKERPDDLE